MGNFPSKCHDFSAYFWSTWEALVNVYRINELECAPKCLILPVSLSSPEQAGLAWSGVQVQVSISQPGKHKAEACRIPGGLPKPDAGTLSALAAFMGCVCVLSHI